MKNKHKIFNIKSKKGYDFIDLTREIIDFTKKSKIKNGIVNIQVMHTSSAIVMNECDEPLLRKDMLCQLERLAPKSAEYHHDNFDIRTVNICDGECDNGHAHCKALFLPATITINLIGGKLQLGTYQKIFFIELDRPRKRNVQVFIMGD